MPNSNQTVRLIRFGKEQSIVAGANPELAGHQPMTSGEPEVVPQ
jgi:pilus assembly protein CpaB